MTAFDPVSAGFVRLLDFQFAGNIDVYEYHNHAAVNGRADVLRINIYLSRDGSYVTIWNGLIEPALAEVRFDLPGDLCFKDLYCEPLFCGHIESAADATIILNALRLTGGRHSVPHVLTGGPHDFRCEPLPDRAVTCKARLTGSLTVEEREHAAAAVFPTPAEQADALGIVARWSGQNVVGSAQSGTDDKLDAVALAMFRAEQDITAVDGDKLPDRHFKVAISRYRGMASAAIKMLGDTAPQKG